MLRAGFKDTLIFDPSDDRKHDLLNETLADQMQRNMKASDLNQDSDLAPFPTGSEC